MVDVQRFWKELDPGSTTAAEGQPAEAPHKAAAAATLRGSLTAAAPATRPTVRRPESNPRQQRARPIQHSSTAPVNSKANAGGGRNGSGGSGDNVGGAADETENAADDKDYDALPVPAGWERRFAQSGRPYYVDHTSRSTQWEHPLAKRRKANHRWTAAGHGATDPGGRNGNGGGGGGGGTASREAWG
ncbi:unnamed protein product [Phaeothamnion confervicola]